MNGAAMTPTGIRAMAFLRGLLTSPSAHRSQTLEETTPSPAAQGPTTRVLCPATIKLMARKASRSALVQSLFCVFLFGWLATQLPARLQVVHPHAQTVAQPLRAKLIVSNATLPITIGVPLPENTNITNAAQLGVVDASGKAVPAQMRVLARWRGTVNETGKAIKWVLVDFKPSANGEHFLTQTAPTNLQAVAVNNTGGTFRVSNTQLELEIPQTGEALVKGFRLGGSEQLRAPLTVQTELRPRALLTQTTAAADTVIVTDTTLLKPGDEIRFEHIDTLKWDAAAGSARLVTNDQSFVAGRRYRVGEGTAQQEEIEVGEALPGDLRAKSALRFNHPSGTTIRDLTAEQETARIKSISGQTVQFSAPLKIAHALNEKLFVATAAAQKASAFIERTSIEEANGLRVVVRQDGSFRSNGVKTPPTLGFTLRYYVYADQPFVRVRLRLTNNGAYGFGAYQTKQPPYAQHALLRSLSVLLPTTAAGASSVQVLTADDAHARLSQQQSGASLVAGAFEIAVPEFVENYPKALRGDANGLRFDVLPDTGNDYVFDGARAKTTDFYLGRNTIAARALTNRIGATLEPGYLASTGAVRPAFVEKRNWAEVFKKEPELAEAATRAERMMASGYAVEASENWGSIPAQSAYEYRLRSEQGEQFGWRNFGDLAWGDGYANLHYDLPFIVLREYLRTGDARAFQLGSEMARYRADWGHYRADDFFTSNWNLRGMAFYEKGDHGSFREPVPSHSWIEGMWLYWALTGDEAVHESALDGSDAFARMNFTYDSALSWNESRWLGWPTLGLMAAFRYTGDAKYLNKARENVYLLTQTEENYGRKGFYIGRGMDALQAVQPWSWTGYTQLGVIEYWRETGDARAADYLVRVADWLVSKGNNPALKPGVTLADGTYLPAGMSYYWYPEKIAEDRSVALAGLCLPVLMTAARISNREDFRLRAQQLFRDFAFYRDLAEGRSVPPSTRAVINFRSVLFAGSATKVYGQMGLTIADYLPELTNSIVTPRGQTLGPTPPRNTTATPTSPGTPVTLPGLVNVALNRPATASSTQIWPDVIGSPNAANDGQLIAAGKASVWHSGSNTGQREWWQVDLGQPYRVQLLELLFRQDQDQPNTRRNLEIYGSNNPSFATFAVLASVGETAVPFGQPWQAAVTDEFSYRYIRVQKTKPDADLYGQSFFNLAEVRVWAQPFPVTTPTPTPVATPLPTLTFAQLTAQKLLVGQSLNFQLARMNSQGQALALVAYNVPENARFNNATGEFWFTPTSSQAGNVYQITFRATTPQNAESFARLDVAVALDGAPNIRLLSPDAGTRLMTGQSALISWSVPLSNAVAKYQLRLSTDGGASYPTLLIELPGNQTQYQWLIPRNFPAANQSGIRFLVKAVDTQNRASVDHSKTDLRVTLSFSR